MNIWLFNHYAVPPWYYPLARPYNFGKYLLRSGNKVSIFAASTVHNSDKNLINDNKKFKVEKIDGINYIYIKARRYKTNGFDRILNMFEYFFKIFNTTKKVVKQFSKPDIIIATSVHPLACVAGIAIAKRYKIKCIAEIADLWPLTLIELGKLKKQSILTSLLYKLEHWIYRNADSIIFTMEGGRDYIIDNGWENEIDLRKVYHINNGVDLEIFEKNENENLYNDLDLDNVNTFKVIYTGSLGKANSMHYLIEAAQILKVQGYNNIKFLIFGDGYLKSELEKYCVDNNMDNVIFKGYVDKKYIPNILSKSNLNIIVGQETNLAKYGASTNKSFDYMASGKPIVYNAKVSYDFYEKYKCGFLSKNCGAEAISMAILKFYNMDEKEYNDYCRNSKDAAKNYDFEVLTLELERIIKNTIHGSNLKVDEKN